MVSGSIRGEGRESFDHVVEEGDGAINGGD